MGAPSHAIFNFSLRYVKQHHNVMTYSSQFLSACPLDMDIHLQSFTIPHFPSLMITMSKPAYLAIIKYLPMKFVIIFVPSHQQCQLSVDDLLTHCSADDKLDQFLNTELDNLQPHLDHIHDTDLAETLKHSIG